MKTFKLNEKDINFSNSWEDLTIKQWIEFYKLNERRNNEGFGEDFYLLSVLEILCDVLPGELDDMSLEDYNNILNDLLFLLEEPKLNETKQVLVGDIYYGFPNSFNDLKTGEYVSIKTLQARYANNLDGLPYLLAVIFRPVIKEIDSETGQECWRQEKFDTKNLDWRANIIYNDVKAIDVMKGVNFFFSGKSD